VRRAAIMRDTRLRRSTRSRRPASTSSPRVSTGRRSGSQRSTGGPPRSPTTLEMPTLEALWRAYADRGLLVLAVSVDRGAPRGLIEPYVRNLNLTFPILLDPELQTSGAWRVTGLPATFLVRP